MANTFKKVYRKIANTGASSDYSLVAEVGLGGNPISSVSTATPGLMPALTGSGGDFLKGDGTWGTLPTASSNTNGLMPSSLVTKLNGIAEGANNYSLPEATSVTRGGILLGGGTSNFLRADGTWATPSASVSSTDSITNGSGALITSGGVYSKLGLSSSENFTVNGTTYATIKAAIDAINTRFEEIVPQYSTLSYIFGLRPGFDPYERYDYNAYTMVPSSAGGGGNFNDQYVYNEFENVTTNLVPENGFITSTTNQYNSVTTWSIVSGYYYNATYRKGWYSESGINGPEWFLLPSNVSFNRSVPATISGYVSLAASKSSMLTGAKIATLKLQNKTIASNLSMTSSYMCLDTNWSSTSWPVFNYTIPSTEITLNAGSAQIYISASSQYYAGPSTVIVQIPKHA